MNKNDEARRKRLRRVVNDAGAQVSLDAEDARWLLDEVGRLQQSNDRLRRQNRRLRLRAQAGGSGDDAAPDEPVGGDEA